MSLVTAIELGWSLIAAVGVAVQVWLLADSYHSLRRTRRLYPYDLDALDVVEGHVRGAQTLLFVHASFLYAGVRALWMPNQPLTFGRAVTIALFSSASIWLLRFGYKDRQTRLRVRARRREAARVGGRRHDDGD